MKLPENKILEKSILKMLIKTAAFSLITVLCWSGLFGITQTVSMAGDSEMSQGNSFIAGILDFELQTAGDFPEVCFGEPSERIINIVNFGNPFKYTASTTEFSGDACNYVNLEASLNGEVKYTGLLSNFDPGVLEYTSSSQWVFKTKFNTDLPSALLGQTCSFKFIFNGTQSRHDLALGEGFGDIEEATSSILAKVCCTTEIRSCGYWKTHSNIYKYLLPQILGGYPADETVNTATEAGNILNAACGSVSSSSMRVKLKGQLLAMKFNIDNFGIGNYVDASTTPKTLNEIVAETDNLLRDPNAPNSLLEEMKNLVEHLNTLETIAYCPETPKVCKLEITKTTTSTEVTPGEDVLYHLTLDNVGGKVCTGGGVKLRDTFGDSLQYVNYVSTRTPTGFNKYSGYIEWNFGNIYPDDSLIEIDLSMKVKTCAHCSSTITNFAKYWSDQTGWGEDVSAQIQVVCKPIAGVVINEFLPNPAGEDGAAKPAGEWVEIYNNSGADVDVAGWWLYDSDNRHELEITGGNIDKASTIIPNGGFLTVYRNGDSDFVLNNTGGDSVRLYDKAISSGGKLIDSHTYTVSAPEGKSFARIPDAVPNWVDPLPTPGESNGQEVISEEIFGEAVSEPDEQMEDGDAVMVWNGNISIDQTLEEIINISDEDSAGNFATSGQSTTTESQEEIILQENTPADEETTQSDPEDSAETEEPGNETAQEPSLGESPAIEEQPVDIIQSIVQETENGENTNQTTGTETAEQPVE